MTTLPQWKYCCVAKWYLCSTVELHPCHVIRYCNKTYFIYILFI